MGDVVRWFVVAGGVTLPIVDDRIRDGCYEVDMRRCGALALPIMADGYSRAGGHVVAAGRLPELSPPKIWAMWLSGVFEPLVRDRPPMGIMFVRLEDCSGLLRVEVREALPPDS